MLSVVHQSAGIGGAAHLVNFNGTDTIAALMAARTYYQCPMAGFSVPAAEHRLLYNMIPLKKNTLLTRRHSSDCITPPIEF